MTVHWFRLRSLNRIASSILIAFAAASALPARADDWPTAAKWAGKYPFQEPKGTNFYELASIRRALVKLVGEPLYRQVILQWGEYPPIQAKGDSILVSGCMPHFCPSAQVSTLVQGRKISVCVYYESLFMPDMPVPKAAKAPDPKVYSVRLWYLAGAGSPLIERNPDDWDGCNFQSVEDAKAMFRIAYSQVE